MTQASCNRVDSSDHEDFYSSDSGDNSNDETHKIHMHQHEIEDNIESDVEEYWDEVPSQFLDRDVGETALPEPKIKKTKMQKLNAIVFWFVYFLLIWQTACKISDNGMTWLLRFIFQFLKVINLEISSDHLTELISILPSSLYLLRQYINYNDDAFTKYVVCQKCSKLHTYDSCLKVVNGKTVPKMCNNTFFSRGRRKTCGTALVKKVILKDKKEKFYPILYYCCNSIIGELENMVKRKGVVAKCEEWRSLRETDTLSDVYDGKIWKDFLTYKGKDFLKAPRNYGLMLNFDFFQPMKHRKDYSVGVLYLVNLNLPRNMRFKWENVIVVGIIPSMDSEPKHLNEFLEPSVKELQLLWKGVRLKSSFSSFPLTFRAAVLAISADIPATRKICGFKSHSAHKGCSRCKKEFPGGFGEKKDYSGFDRERWPKRTTKEHVRIAEKMQQSKTIKNKKELGKKHGISHWSALLKLEYFDVVRFCTVDPMHNLFLGTAKYVFKYWDSIGVLGRQQMKILEKRIEQMDVASDMGRLPKKISTNYGSFTAMQWKNWTLIYSIFALKGVIEDEHFRCWQTFTLACKHLCKPSISEVDLKRADLLLLKFCRQFESLYGKDAVTPNMHLHCHLKEIIEDHGPVYSFWCFSFERYNGIMGSVTTNKRSVELQLMRKLMLSRHLDLIEKDKEFATYFTDVLTSPGSADGNAEPSFNYHSWLKKSTTCNLSSVDWTDTSCIILPNYHRLKSFHSSDLELLLDIYKVLYPTKDIQLSSLAETVKLYPTINIANRTYGSAADSRSIRSSRIYASWPNVDGSLNLHNLVYYAGKVDYYFSHSIQLDSKFACHVFAVVSWYMPDSNQDAYGNPTKTWKLEFICGGPSRFMPVQRIHCQYACAEVHSEGQKHLVTVALEKGH